MSHTGPLTVAHLNTQSVLDKQAELQHFMHQHNVDIFSLNETWLNKNKKFKISNYRIFRRDRTTSRGGGVCLAIHQNLIATTVEHQFQEECIIIRLPNIINGTSDLIVSSYYNPPDTTVNPVLLDFIFKLGEHVLLLGDLNAHSSTWNSKKDNNSGIVVNDFINNTHNMLLNNNEATYEPLHRPEYSAILDLAISSQQLSQKFLSFTTHEEPRSDHITFTTTFNINRRLQPTKELTIKKINWETFKSSLEASRPQLNTIISTSADIDSTTATLTATLQQAMKNATKIHTLKKNSNHAYLPNHILKLIKEKKETRRLYQNTRDPTLKSSYNKLTELIKTNIINHKQHQWQEFCNSINKNQISDSKLWQKIRSINNPTNGNTPRSPELNHNNTKTTDPTITSNIFADYLESVFDNYSDSNLDNSFFEHTEHSATSLFSYSNSNSNHQECTVDPTTPTTKSNNTSHTQASSNITNTNTDFSPVTIDELTKAIKKLKNKSACGGDHISNKMLKNLPVSYLHFLTKLFNTSMTLGHLPAAWKEATIILIPKPQKDHSTPQGYRPISLLNTLSKLLERVVYSRLEDWLVKNKVLSQFQSGFRRFRQTKDHTIRLIQAAQSCFNQNQKMGAIFFDMGIRFCLAQRSAPQARPTPHTYLPRQMDSMLPKRENIQSKDWLNLLNHKNN